MHGATRSHEAQRQGLFDGKRIGAEIMSHHDFGLDPALVKIAPERKAQRLDPDEVDLLGEEPARIIFAKPVRGDQWLGFKRVSYWV